MSSFSFQTPPEAPGNFAGAYRTDPAALAVYSEAAGIARVTPEAVAQPASAADVEILMRWAAERGVPLIPRGSGSSMSGGAVGHGVVVDLSRLRQRHLVDARRRLVRAGPGRSRREVDDDAAAEKLLLPPDPSSGAFATVGGMCATNAAGAHTLGYGATRRWVNGLECVFDNGSRVWIRRGEELPSGIPAIDRFLAIAPVLARRARELPASAVRKDSSGYALRTWMVSQDLVDLLAGSEGTLALFTEVEFRLIDRPSFSASLLAAFDSLEACVAAAIEATALGAAACELLDRTFLDVARRGHAAIPVPDGAEAVLLMEVTGDSADQVREAARVLGATMTAREASRVELALDAESESELWSLRHAASPILSALDPALASMQFVEDSAVPPGRLPEYVRGVREILERHSTTGVIFGHAGDAHMHVNPLIDTSRQGWRSRVELILRDVAELTVSLSGTLAGEHGDGRLRTPLLEQTHGALATELYAQVKHAFDPGGILNPGVKVPVPGQQPLDVIKYDPELSPHPPAAARALEFVARERAYMANRLELLDALPEGEPGNLALPD
ncbi:MAG TPA: FAD-binding oxidoreductase [Gemmatimonadales bacterium]|nr:FAD-binding oxidoreductase [Gemmatimonadales bacterium]